MVAHQPHRRGQHLVRELIAVESVSQGANQVEWRGHGPNLAEHRATEHRAQAQQSNAHSDMGRGT